MPTKPEFAREVGVAFIRAYYGATSPPSALAHMYSKDSVFVRTHRENNDEDVTAYGSQPIKDFLLQQPQAKYQLSYVECSPTTADSILIQVEGTYCTEFKSNSFHQTFVLAPNSRADASFYIHNDIMRIWEDEPTEAVKPADEYQPQPPADEPVDQVPEPVEELAEEPVRGEAEIESIVENVINVVDADQEADVSVREPSPDPEQTQEPVGVAEPEGEEVVEEEDAAAEEAAEEAEQEPAEGEADEVEDKEEEIEKSTAGMSYAQILAYKKRVGAGVPSKTQVVSGGAVPTTIQRKVVVDPERPKKRQDKDMSALNLIRANGKGDSGKGSKGASGKGSKGSKGEKGEKGAASGPFSVYVTRLPKTFTDEDCESVFGPFGKISGKTLRSQDGYAYIDFESKAAAQKALAKPITFGDATLGVEEKKSKGARPEREGKDGGARVQRKEQRRN